MRRAALLCIAVATTVLPTPAQAAPVCKPPRCRDVRVPVPTGLKVPDARVRVLLPEGYARTRARYPVVYVLHGVADTYRTWTQLTDLVTFSRRFRAIFVLPDGGRGSKAGWYSNWKDGSRHWETFHTKVLVRYVDRNFRTRGRGYRGVVGVSMGGFGAMKYAARHPGTYRAAASLSGYLDTMYAAPASGIFYHHAGQGYEGESLGTPTENVWGDQLSDEENWRANNPRDLAEHLKGVRLYVASGMGTPGGTEGDDPMQADAYPAENFIWQTNMSFTDALEDADVPYRSHFYAGYHDWPYWERELHRVLPRLLRVLDG